MPASLLCSNKRRLRLLPLPYAHGHFRGTRSVPRRRRYPIAAYGISRTARIVPCWASVLVSYGGGVERHLLYCADYELATWRRVRSGLGQAVMVWCEP